MELVGVGRGEEGVVRLLVDGCMTDLVGKEGSSWTYG